MSRITTPFGFRKTAAEGIGGRYFVDCNEAEIVSHRLADYSGVAPYAFDLDNVGRLWEESLRVLA